MWTIGLVCPASSPPLPPVRKPRARPRHTRPTAALTALGFALAGLVACGTPEEEPEVLTVLTAFTEALSLQDAALAAHLTTAPDAAAPVLEQVFTSLGADGVDFVVQQLDSEGQGREGVGFTLGSEWSFGEGPFGTRLWTTSTNGTAVRGPGGWQIAWDPAVVVPELTAQDTLRFAVTPPPPPSVLDREGEVLMRQQEVNLVYLDPAAVASTAAAAESLAGVLAPVVPSLTAQSIAETIASGQGKQVFVVALRDEDYLPVADQLAVLPGVSTATEPRLLTSSKQLNSPVFNDLRAKWEAEQEEASGWAVQLVRPNGQVVTLEAEEGLTPADVDVTLDLRLQLAAQAALADIPQAAVLVAIEPSSGGVLAVAQNAAANSQGPIALTGLYPPGSTFKTVTVAAALDAGVVGPDDTVDCPGKAVFEGREIPNSDEFDLGEVPLRTAFARSCNTTMAELALRLPDDALTEMALRFGLGVGFDTPGLTTVTGTVPPADSPAALVEAAIGQGALTATPFGMALVAATVAGGEVPLPEFVVGEPGEADQEVQAPPEEVLEDLRAMMREVVTDGTATQLRDIPEVIGKTGTAEHGDAGGAHGWFIAVQGDVAFAVFIEDAGGSAPAVDAAGRFLRAVATG